MFYVSNWGNKLLDREDLRIDGYPMGGYNPRLFQFWFNPLVDLLSVI